MPPEVPAEVPVPIALLVADEVYNDQGTNKWIVAGIFSVIFTEKVPTRHDHLTVFFQLTNIREQVDLRLRIEHAEEGDILFELGGPLAKGSPLEVYSRAIVLRNFLFPKAGKYWIQLVSDSQILIQSPLYVKLFEKKQGQQEQANEPT